MIDVVVAGETEKAASCSTSRDSASQRKKLEGWGGSGVCVEIILCVFKKIFPLWI